MSNNVPQSKTIQSQAAPRASTTACAILISGRGTNMLALIKAAQAPDYPADIRLIISNNPDALGLKKAQDLGITTAILDDRDYNNRADFDQALDAKLKRHKIEFIACAGFMRILGKNFTQKWMGRIINIHPSLLPKYKGLNTHQRALEAGDIIHGCTVHWLNADLDAGEIIAQSEIAIENKDTPHSLAAKVLQVEVLLYPKALKMALKAYKAKKIV